MEGHTAEERVRISGGDLGSRLRQGGEPGWRGHLGGATPLQTGVRLQALTGTLHLGVQHGTLYGSLQAMFNMVSYM